jgi:hypothetical protein
MLVPIRLRCLFYQIFIYYYTRLFKVNFRIGIAPEIKRGNMKTAYQIKFEYKILSFPLIVLYFCPFFIKSKKNQEHFSRFILSFIKQMLLISARMYITIPDSVFFKWFLINSQYF